MAKKYFPRTAEKVMPFGNFIMPNHSGIGYHPETLRIFDARYLLKSGETNDIITSGDISGANIGSSSIQSGQIVFQQSNGQFAGSSNLFWDDANKRIGIGTSQPSAEFHIYNSSGGIPRISLESPSGFGIIGRGSAAVAGGGSTDLGIRSNANLLFGAGGTAERMRINSAGDVGIGTALPSSKLDVNGSFSASLVKSATYFKGGEESISIPDDAVPGNPANYNLTGAYTIEKITNNDADGANVTILAGTQVGQILTIVNLGANNITIQTANCRLAGGVTYAMTQYDTLTLISVKNGAVFEWWELARSVNA